MFIRGDKIGIVCCSNGQKCTYVEKIKLLENTLTEIGLQAVFTDYIYEKEGIFVRYDGNVRAKMMLKKQGFHLYTKEIAMLEL